MVMLDPVFTLSKVEDVADRYQDQLRLNSFNCPRVVLDDIHVTAFATMYYRTRCGSKTNLGKKRDSNILSLQTISVPSRDVDVGQTPGPPMSPNRTLTIRSAGKLRS